MSVIEAKRNPGKLTVLVKASELATYTLTICKNEKCFPKRDRWLLTQEIVRDAVALLAHIRRANAVAVKLPQDYAYRRGEQIQALSRIASLLGSIDLAYTILPLEHRRVEYWTGLIVQVETLLRAWIRSDATRYADMANAQN